MHARRARTVYHTRKEGSNSLKCLLWQLQLLTRSGPFFGDPIDTKRINLLLHRHPTFPENKNSCLGHFSHLHISIHNHQEGSLEAPVNTKNHHLYGHHWRANYSQKILFLLEEHKELTVCCIITILLLDTLFDENRCLIQNKAKLMWVQTGAILMANILSLVDWSSLKWKF